MDKLLTEGWPSGLCNDCSVRNWLFCILPFACEISSIDVANSIDAVTQISFITVAKNYAFILTCTHDACAHVQTKRYNRFNAALF
jgi:hypothetical protein